MGKINIKNSPKSNHFQTLIDCKIKTLKENYEVGVSIYERFFIKIKNLKIKIIRTKKISLISLIGRISSS